MKKLCIYLFLLTGVLSFGQTTRCVNGSTGDDSGDCTNSSNPCSSIGYTIEQASSGDVIEIADGFYTESLFFSKSLTLIGESTTGTIIQAGEEPLSAWAFISVIEIEEGVHLTLSNAHIRHGGAFQGGGIMSWGELTLSSAIVSDNEILGSGGGIYSVGPATLTDVIIRDNHSIQFGVGGGMISESSTTLANVEFIGNSATQAGGLQIQNETHTLKNSKSIKAYPALQEIGSEWYSQQNALILCVPSVLVHWENNYLINTSHPDFKKKVSLLKTEDFIWDSRLI